MMDRPNKNERADIVFDDLKRVAWLLDPQYPQRLELLREKFGRPTCPLCLNEVTNPAPVPHDNGTWHIECYLAWDYRLGQEVEDKSASQPDSSDSDSKTESDNQ